ncbi:MAG: hypothetical protein GY754_00750 [bacterium]|nr:hypothetical protein [bacterium]
MQKCSFFRAPSSQKKLVLIISGFMLLALFAGAPRFSFLYAAPLFSENDSNKEISVKPSNFKYYLANIVGESYNPIFYDDYLVSCAGKPVLHFTRISGSVVDFYYYITHPKDIAFVTRLFEKNQKRLNSISPKLIRSLKQYASTKPRYPQKKLYSAVAGIIGKSTNISVAFITQKISLKQLDSVLYRYLHSNAIRSLDDLEDNPLLLKTVVDKFFMLCTTSFYREWRYIKGINIHLRKLSIQAQKEKRVFKVKIFACSTGEEVLTYAVELLEGGIRNFTILASDINNSSLEYARNMKYSNATFQVLPLKMQNKLKKYFRLNKKVNIWEPRDPTIFSSRIRYINHNILKEIPPGLDPRFAPPYDLVSIMNVLLYLDKEAVNDNKDYWLDIIRAKGLLVLHDKRYSIANGSLGRKWGFKNFFCINEWANIKLSKRYTPEMKVAAYKKIYTKLPDFELAFKMLLHAYVDTGQDKMALKLCHSYLKKNPHSSYALNWLLKKYMIARNNKKIEETTMKLSLLRLPSAGMLHLFSRYEKNKKEKLYLKLLEKKYTHLTTQFKKNPLQTEKLFSFRKPYSEKWRLQQHILHAYTCFMLQRFYLSDQKINDFERVTIDGVTAISEIILYDPDYVIDKKLFLYISERYISYCISQEQFQKLLHFCNRGIMILEQVPINKKTEKNIYLNYLVGNFYLHKALMLEKTNGDMKEIKMSVDKSIAGYKRFFTFPSNIISGMLLKAYSKMGKSYSLQARYYFSKGQTSAGKRALLNSLRILEMGLEINPIYSKELLKTREKLFGLSRKHGISLQ